MGRPLDAQSTATKKAGPSDASNPNGPYRVIEIVAGDCGSVGQLCATSDDSAGTRSRNAIRALT